MEEIAVFTNCTKGDGYVCLKPRSRWMILLAVISIENNAFFSLKIINIGTLLKQTETQHLVIQITHITKKLILRTRGFGGKYFTQISKEL